MDRLSIPRDQTERHFLDNSDDTLAITTSIIFDGEYFINEATKLPGPRCASHELSAELRNVAKKKNGKAHDKSNENLLFPPSIIQRTLVRDKVRRILGCECTLCSSVKGRDLLTDEILTDAITTEDGDEQRRLFALLVFIGAGFAARHVCSFHTRGWDIITRESSIQNELFVPLGPATQTIFPPPAEITQIFITIFRDTWPLFSTPVMKIGNHKTSLSGENLPFLNERPLNSDKSSFGSMYTFEIHPEFRGLDIPTRAVRKEITLDNSTDEERRILEFLARCGKPNFIKLLFWYQYHDKVNYVFPHYPGSLHQLLEGNIQGQVSPSKPEKYRSVLQHWLWQGMVDVTGALKFFHFPDQNILPGQMIAAHFDLKPMNILVDEKGTLIVTDFGQARIRALGSIGETSLTAQIGDFNYRPPPMVPRKPLAGSVVPQNDPKQDVGLRFNRAYDVWSLACIMTEVIEYITLGSQGFKSFRDRRFKEDQSSSSFWKLRGEGGGYEVKLSVQETLRRFRTFNDQYLNMVTDLLETMFSIDPLLRPPIADCFSIISEDIPTDEWPLKDDDEFSICGLGTNPQLRNMHTQFQRKSEYHARRCKMYLLSTISGTRIRLALEFDKEMNDASQQSQISCVLSDSARRGEEEYKPLSLLDPTFKPMSGKPLLCSFAIVHPNLKFMFDEAQRGLGLEEYYHFLTAVTRQRSQRLRPQRYMPISKCTIKLPSFRGRKEIFHEGHVEIWRELTEDEYIQEFTYTPPARKMSEINPPGLGNDRIRHDSVYSTSRHDSIYSTSSPTTASGSSGSSGPPIKSSTAVKTRRLVVFLPGRPSRLLTINLTNRLNKARLFRDGAGNKSEAHVCFTAVGGSFYIGNFAAEDGCPGVPLDPEVLAGRETFHVDWVELEFQNPDAMAGFKTLWDKLYPHL